MARQNLSLLIWILTGLSLSSCQPKKTYCYKEGGKEKLIEAYSDSAAYLEAFQDFEIAKKVYNEMKQTVAGSYLSEPISFELLNDKREDITYKVSFLGKDSLEKMIARNINNLPNSIAESSQKRREEKHGVGAKYDTGGLYLAPIKVLSAKFVSKEYSSYKDVALRYKNVSKKVVSAIRFKWYGENAFNEPADMSRLDRGWGGGFTDDALSPGETSYSEWSILSRDGKKILIAYPYEVAFKDGTKWKLPE